MLIQLRQVRAKLESDYAISKKRESELEGKLESSKEGREDSVIFVLYVTGVYWSFNSVLSIKICVDTDQKVYVDDCIYYVVVNSSPKVWNTKLMTNPVCESRMSDKLR